jgi:hypothetical protein
VRGPLFGALAAALTSYAGQGGTWKRSTSRCDAVISRAVAYVTSTRGEDANDVFITHPEQDSDVDTLPRLPRPAIADAVSRRLDSSEPQRTAIELIALSEDTPAAASSRHAKQSAERLADPALLKHLPPRPHAPYLVARWRHVIAEVMAYQERWSVRPSEQEWGWLAGQPDNDPAHASDSRDVIRAVTELHTACLAEALRAHGWAELPTWAVTHSNWLASRGQFPPRPEALAELYARVAAYRAELQVESAPITGNLIESVLGIDTDDPSQVARRARLAANLRRQNMQATGAGVERIGA